MTGAGMWNLCFELVEVAQARSRRQSVGYSWSRPFAFFFFDDYLCRAGNGRCLLVNICVSFTRLRIYVVTYRKRVFLERERLGV